MINTSKKDLIQIERIQKDLNNIKKWMAVVSKYEVGELDSLVEAYGVIQAIVNIKASYDRIGSEEVLESLAIINKPKFRLLRNIGSHDYASINWVVVKELFKMLEEEYTDEFFENLRQKVSKDVNKIAADIFDEK